MTIEIESRAFTNWQIDTLLRDINPKETATVQHYNIKNPTEGLNTLSSDYSYKSKKVTSSEHFLIKNFIDKYTYRGVCKSGVMLYYPENSYSAMHCDNDYLPGCKYSSIVFLNDGFEGGDLIYPNQGCIMRPTKGVMITAPCTSEYPHFVTQITKGERFSLVFRFY